MPANTQTAGPTGSGILPGLISWFGGPNDPSSGPTTASGAPVSKPGIAVYNRATLGGWWMVKLPNGTITLTQQTDIGPAPSTGRTFDFTYSLLQYLGYNEKNFPTNGSAQGVYIGKGSTLQDVMGKYGTQISNALGHLGATPKQSAAFITQADVGAGGNHGATFAVSSGGTPASPAPTTPSGDVQALGPNINFPNIPAALSGIWSTILKDAKYAGVFVALLVFAVLLMHHALSGGGGSSKTKIVPVPA